MSADLHLLLRILTFCQGPFLFTGGASIVTSGSTGRGASQLPPRRPSTAAAVRAPPRGGARLARPQLPAPPQRRRSREKLARTRRGGGGGRAGLPTAAATSAPHPEGRPPLCFVADFSARSPRTEPSEEGGGGVAAASATLPAECQVEEGNLKNGV